MKPSDLVEKMLSEDAGTPALQLRQLGFAPLDQHQKMAFQGAGPQSVAMEYSGPGFSCTFIYDLESQQFEAISDDAVAIGALYEAPADSIVGFVKSFLAAPSLSRLKHLIQTSGGQVMKT